MGQTYSGVAAVTAVDLSRAPPVDRRHEAALFGTLAAVYFGAGCLLMLRYNLFDPDGISRVANAGYVVHSRDPHLSAVGFVWNPLPSLVEIPLLQFSPWWPQLRTHGLAGVAQSAVFMAASAVMVGRIARDRALGTGWRMLAVGAFALQPMIVVYGASGMSEASEIFCLLWCVRRLLRWTDTHNPGDLACAGLALGVGYLTRYEVVPAAFGAAVFVGATTVYRSAGARIGTAMAHVAIVMFPIVMAAGIWALTGWVVNQELFATLSSHYGNFRQVEAAIDRGGPQGRAASGDWVVISARLLGMQPFAGIAAAGAAAYAVLSRRLAPLVPVVVIGPVLAFAIWGQFSSTTFGWFRFYLLAIPLVVCIAMTGWAAPARPPAAVRTAASALLCVSVLIGFPETVRAMLNERIGNQQLQFGFNSLLRPDSSSGQDLWYRRLLLNDRIMADYLDRQGLPDGSVLMDTFNTWGVWLSSARPRQFIVSSDYDFKAALNRPWKFGVKYLLVSNPAISDADALNVRYPSLWADGAGIATLVYSIYGATDEDRFRLYAVKDCLSAPAADFPNCARTPVGRPACWCGP